MKYLVTLEYWNGAGYVSIDRFFFPFTEAGLRKARDKRAELLVRYTDMNVELSTVEK